MPLRVGGQEVVRAYLGSQVVQRLSLGAVTAWTPPAPADLFALAPADDIPTISTASSGASVLLSPTIGQGWHREKRVGVAENTPGSAQSSTAAADLDGSTRYRYPGMPAAIGSPSNAGQYIATQNKPGGSSQAAMWLCNVEFVTTSPRVAFRINTVAANGNFGLIFVDGKRISERATTLSGTSAGAGMEVVLTFPTAKQRTIRVVSMNTTQGRWGGVAVDAGHTVTKPTAPVTRRVAVIGDSYVNGSSGTANNETFCWRLAHQMGADEVIAAGIGGTGWLTTIGGDNTSVFSGRNTAVQAMNPHVVIWAGGRNDTALGLQASVEASLDAFPGVERYIIPTASESGQGSVRDAMAAAAASRGVRYLNAPVDSLEKIADGVHFTYAGHTAYANAILALL